MYYKFKLEIIETIYESKAALLLETKSSGWVISVWSWLQLTWPSFVYFFFLKNFNQCEILGLYIPHPKGSGCWEMSVFFIESPSLDRLPSQGERASISNLWFCASMFCVVAPYNHFYPISPTRLEATRGLIVNGADIIKKSSALQIDHDDTWIRVSLLERNTL